MDRRRRIAVRLFGFSIALFIISAVLLAGIRLVGTAYADACDDPEGYVESEYSSRGKRVAIVGMVLGALGAIINVGSAFFGHLPWWPSWLT